MLYALSEEHQKVNATPKTKAYCPGCGDLMIPKCGEINVWHWAHKSKVDCDSWREHETAWHLRWKGLFPTGCVESIFIKNGIKHIADVINYDGIVIELQHSPISTNEIEKREEFYGNMIWVFDVIEPYKMERIDFRKHTDYLTFRWFYPRKYIAYAKRPSYLDFGNPYLIFEIKKMYPETPCGGWGYMIRKNDFVKNLTNSPELD